MSSIKKLYFVIINRLTQNNAPPILNTILRKNGSVEERGIVNMFDKVEVFF